MIPESSDQEGKDKKRAPLSGLSPIGFIFLSLALIFFLYQIVGGSLAYMAGGEDMLSGSNINLIRIILSFGQFMFILVPSVVLVMLKGDNLRETFRLKMPGLSIFLMSVLGIIIIQPFLQALVYFQNELIFSIPGSDIVRSLKEMFDSIEETTMKLVNAETVFDFIIVLFVIAVTPAISEEFMFRGLVQSNFEKTVAPSRAVFLTGTIFALFHFHPFNLIPLIVLGWFLSFMVFASGSIYTAIAAHFLNNLISASAVYIYGTETFGSDAMTGSEKTEFAVAGIVSLLLFLILVRLMKKISLNQRMESNSFTANE